MYTNQVNKFRVRVRVRVKSGTQLKVKSGFL